VKRILILLTCLAALTAATTALAAGHRARLKLGATDLGKLVENGRGFTVYMFTRDRRNKDNCVLVPSCASFWPPLTTSGKALAGHGVKAKLIGSISLGHGVRQVTYAGHPLYTYSGDTGPGQTFYVGASQFGGQWFALNAAGHAVK
jgi:predicted lipoprotein with Yx(FWY)xxD motif